MTFNNTLIKNKKITKGIFGVETPPINPTAPFAQVPANIGTGAIPSPNMVTVEPSEAQFFTSWSKMFPDKDLETSYNKLLQNDEVEELDFISTLRSTGRNPETESLLSTMFPDITPQQMDEIFYINYLDFSGTKTGIPNFETFRSNYYKEKGWTDYGDINKLTSIRSKLNFKSESDPIYIEALAQGTEAKQEYDRRFGKGEAFQSTLSNALQFPFPTISKLVNPEKPDIKWYDPLWDLSTLLSVGAIGATGTTAKLALRGLDSALSAVAIGSTTIDNWDTMSTTEKIINLGLGGLSLWGVTVETIPAIKAALKSKTSQEAAQLIKGFMKEVATSEAGSLGGKGKKFDLSYNTKLEAETNVDVLKRKGLDVSEIEFKDGQYRITVESKTLSEPSTMAKEPWQMTKAEASADSRIKIGGEMGNDIARVDSDGKVVLSNDFFDMNVKDRQEIWSHELTHSKTGISKITTKSFWDITESNLFGKYDETAEKWVAGRGFSGRNVNEALTQAVADFEKNPAVFSQKFPQQTPIVKAISEGKTIPQPTTMAKEATVPPQVTNVPPKPPKIPTKPVDISQPSPEIKPTPLSENVIGLKPIKAGLVRGEVIGNWAKNLVGKVTTKLGGNAPVLADELASPAMRMRTIGKENSRSVANIIGTQAEVSINNAFKFDKNGRIASLVGIDPSVPGAPTIRDVAARLPRYASSLSPEQLAVLTKVGSDITPYRDLLTELGVEIHSRPDVMEGGFYLPRGNAALEGVDEPLKISGGGRKGGKKGFEKPSIFASEAEGIEAGYEYTPIGQSITSYAYDAGIKATDAHIANYFKTLTDETGQLLGETPKMRLMKRNPDLAQLVEENKKTLTRLQSNIDALTDRQMKVIDRWKYDPDYGDIDDLLLTLEEMKGGRPPFTKPELIDLLEQAKAEARIFRPDYKRAMEIAKVTPRDKGVIIMPALNGRVFPNEIANVVNKVLKAEGETVGALAPAANTLHALNNTYRGIRATGDNSFTGIQGLLTAYDDPVAAAKALKVNAKAWGLGGDKVLGTFINDFDLTEVPAGRLAAKDWGRYGGHVGGATSEMQMGGVGSKVGELPFIKQANRAFGYTGDSLRLLRYSDELKKLLKTRTLKEIIASGDLEKITRAVNGFTGYAVGKTLGSIGEFVMFAPKFFQSRLETIARGFMGFRPGAGLDQKMARNALLKMMGTGVVLTVAANEALGEDTDFRFIVDGKRNPAFMRIKFEGNNYSLFGSWDSLLGMAINVGTGEPLRALRSTASGSLAMAWDIISGKDYDWNNVTDTPANFAKWVGSQFVPFSMGNLPETVKQVSSGNVIGGVTQAVTQIGGIKSYPVPETEALKEIPGYLGKIGSEDTEALNEALDGIDNPKKQAEIKAKDWTYDITSLRRDISKSIQGLKPEDMENLPEIVTYYRDSKIQQDGYDLLSEEEKTDYLEVHPEYTINQFFWGNWSGWQDHPTTIDMAYQLEELATQYGVPLTAIPAFGKTESGKERLPPKELWQDYFDYYALDKLDTKTGKMVADTAKRDNFRYNPAHKAFRLWGIANLGWTPIPGTSVPSSTTTIKSGTTTTPPKPPATTPSIGDFLIR
jgi:hypothetical protein